MTENKLSDKKPIKLIDKQQIIIIAVSEIIGIGVAGYYIYKARGGLDSIFIISLLANMVLISFLTIGLVWYANKPEKSDKDN